MLVWDKVDDPLTRSGVTYKVSYCILFTKLLGHRLFGRAVMRPSMQRKIWGSNIGLVKLDSVLPMALYGCNVSLKRAVLPGRSDAGWAQQTCYTLRRNTASEMKYLFWFEVALARSQRRDLFGVRSCHLSTTHGDEGYISHCPFYCWTSKMKTVITNFDTLWFGLTCNRTRVYRFSCRLLIQSTSIWLSRKCTNWAPSCPNDKLVNRAVCTILLRNKIDFEKYPEPMLYIVHLYEFKKNFPGSNL